MTAFLVAMTSLVLVDQAVKAVVLLLVPTEGSIGSVIRIRPARAAGTFAGRIGAPLWLQTAIWLGIVILVVVHGGIAASGLRAVALGAALGGATSNLVDVVARGGIVDYVDLRVWPAFNLADAAIVLGIVGAIVAR